MVLRPEIGFDRLIYAVEQVANHASYPGKDEAVKLCMDDIDGLFHDGRIDADQWKELRAVLQDAERSDGA